MEFKMVSAYDELPRTAANFVALSPLRYLERAAYIYPHQDAIIHGDRRISWHETYTRCRQFADQLQTLSAQQLLANASGLALNAKPIPRM